jgi:thioredoxin reductase (NADPH)
MVREVVIIGSGAAGLTAGIYLGRFKRSPLIIDGGMPGGQLMTTGAVENWPGDISVEGPDLMKRMREHAKACGSEFEADEAVDVDFSQKPFAVVTKNGKKILAKSVIVATGSSPKKLGVPGEEKYWGRGVNTCATCDAPLYAGKNVVVVGGGNSAIAESYALSKHAKKVTIIQLLDKLTATDPLTDKALEQPNVSVLLNKKVIEIIGDEERITHAILEDQKDKSKSEFKTEGLFVAIGLDPNSKPFKNKLSIDKYGYIIKDNGVTSSVEGVFVAGDVADFKYRQAVTAAGEGCKAALECEIYLQKLS